MLETDKKISIASEQEIAHLDEMLKNIDADISIGMSCVRRAQGLSFKQLEKRFSGLSREILRRYLQQSYPHMRPVHFVAAYSWIMMVPTTSFFYGLKAKEQFRGMDDEAVDALMCIGRLTTSQFNLIISLIETLLSEESRQRFGTFKEEIKASFYSSEDYDSLFPPAVLDLQAFAIDYYRSVAVTMKKFRLKHDITPDTMARVLGLSTYQYDVLEDEYKTTPFSISIGARIRLGFKLNSHAGFTSEMRQFPEFHQLRRHQHYRDLLIVEALRLVSPFSRQCIINLIKELALIHIRSYGSILSASPQKT